MHELGIVFYIIDDVKEAATNAKATRVSRVTLQLGEVSGVVPNLLTSAWEWASKREPLVENAALEVEEIPAVTYCEGCASEYPTVAHGKICPNCGSDKTYLLYGREVMIKEIEAY